MNEFKFWESRRHSEGYNVRIYCDEKKEELLAYIERLNLPYLKSISFLYHLSGIVVQFPISSKKEERKEFRQIIEGFFHGFRVIPKHFVRARFFLPWQTQRIRASWWYDY